MSSIQRLVDGRKLVGLVVVLALAVAGLGVALGVALSDGDSDSHSADSGYPGMMMAMGNMDTSVMLERMKEVLGPDGFQKLMDHMRNEAGMPATAGAGIDQMMHRMMDGMLSQMPMDSAGQLPSGGHHESTTPAK